MKVLINPVVYKKQTIIRFLIGLAFFIFCLSLHAQDNTSQTEKDYQKFKAILTEESLSADTSSTGSGTNTLHPASLPDWFFDIPASGNQTLYAIGISDPGMEKEKAFQLAVLRAKSVLALVVHPRISSITDNYSIEKQNKKEDEFTTKYENLYNIFSALTAGEKSFEVAEEYFTSFGESIVLVKYDTGAPDVNNADSILTEVDSYQVERQKYNKFEMEEKLAITGQLIPQKDVRYTEGFSYSFQSLNNLFEIKSVYREEELPFPYFIFRYQGESDSLTTTFENTVSNKLNYGLWKTYFETLVQKVTLLSQAFSVNIRQVGDDFSSNTQVLSREVSEARPSFQITRVHVSNNRLFVDMDYLNEQQ